MSIGESKGTVHPEMLKDIQILTDNTDRLSDIVKAPVPPAASAPGFARKVAESLELPESDVDDIVRALWRTKLFQKNRGVSPEQAVELIDRLLEMQAPGEWKEKHLNAWKKCSSQLGDLLEAVDDDHPLLIAFKAQDLAYTHQNILVSSKLVTDIRPVFNSSREQLRALVITHTLFIRYSDANQMPCVASFTVDSADVADLLSECQRAATKTKTVRDTLHTFNPIVLPEYMNES